MAGDDAMAGPLPIRREGSSIVVELPRRARRFLVDTAEALQRSIDDPSSPGFTRLYGRLDESTEIDDPVFTLERQTAIDEVCRMVVESAHRTRLSDAEAEAWLRMFGMAVMMTAANAGVRTDDDLQGLDRKRSRLLDLLRSMQLLLVRCLDPALDDAAADPGDLESS